MSTKVKEIQVAVERAQQAEASKQAEISAKIEETKAAFEKKRAESARAERIATSQQWRELAISSQEKRLDKERGAHQRAWLFDNSSVDPAKFDEIWPKMRREMAESAARAALV